MKYKKGKFCFRYLCFYVFYNTGDEAHLSYYCPYNILLGGTPNIIILITSSSRNFYILLIDII